MASKIVMIGFLSCGLLSCSEDKTEIMKKTKVVICFDVEDYTSPASVGMDDIPKRLAEIMTEEQVTGTFFVIGEKARSLKKRGRSDVIEAMAQHDIGLHTNYGSIHPTITEILEDKSWEEGIAIMKKNESQGIEDIRKIFGKEVIPFARHGGSYGPQLIAALGQLGTNYVYSPIGLPGHNATWFCNTLNIYGVGDYYVADDVFSDDQQFDSLFNVLNREFRGLIDDLDVVSFFVGHPSKMRSIQFWDINYYYGANPDSTEWITPELRPEESMEIVYRNFRNLLKFLKSQDYIEVTTYAEILKDFSHQKDQITQGELAKISEKVLNSGQMDFLEDYSWAEIFYALSFSISKSKENGELPDFVNVVRPFGPVNPPHVNPEAVEIPANQVWDLATQAIDYINANNHLPDRLVMNEMELGTKALLSLFCQSYNNILSGNGPSGITLTPISGFPDQQTNRIIQEVKDVKGWPVHRKDLDMRRLAEMTRWQLWTLKPARER